ncbi:MAG TPA: hypothetical protein VNN06_04220 [Ramlibacter sp.]|nr:hypothetical protein [Ramlibacter sp.]
MANFTPTPHQWSHQVIERSRALYLKRAGAQTPQEEKRRLTDALRTLYQRPSSGRTTALGRRVEKPGDASPAGPSGQRDTAKHDGKHTNK